jgi:hypothetical protein
MKPRQSGRNAEPKTEFAFKYDEQKSESSNCQTHNQAAENLNYAIVYSRKAEARGRKRRIPATIVKKW